MDTLCRCTFLFICIQLQIAILSSLRSSFWAHISVEWHVCDCRIFHTLCDAPSAGTDCKRKDIKQLCQQERCVPWSSVQIFRSSRGTAVQFEAEYQQSESVSLLPLSLTRSRIDKIKSVSVALTRERESVPERKDTESAIARIKSMNCFLHIIFLTRCIVFSETSITASNKNKITNQGIVSHSSLLYLVTTDFLKKCPPNENPIPWTVFMIRLIKCYV